MIIDKDLLLADDQVLTGGDAVTTNYVDFGSLDYHGKGAPLCVEFIVTATATDATALVFYVEVDDGTNFSGAVKVSAADLGAAPAAGSKVKILVPPDVSFRYLRGGFDGTGTIAAGTFVAFVSPLGQGTQD